MQIERLKYGDCTVYMLTHNGEVIYTKMFKDAADDETFERGVVAVDFATQVRRCEIVDCDNETKRKFYEQMVKAKNKETDKILEVLE